MTPRRIGGVDEGFQESLICGISSDELIKPTAKSTIRWLTATMPQEMRFEFVEFWMLTQDFHQFCMKRWPGIPAHDT
jgi:hypothetical protein